MIVDKPWGRVVTYALNQPSSVRVITVDPGKETAAHYHQLRDEVWVVLDPDLIVQIGDRRIDAAPGDEFMVSAEAPHHIENRGERPGRVLDIAYGYTTDDDTFGAESGSTALPAADW